MEFLKLRNIGYQKLFGDGLEVGAFEHPANIPANCNVEYLDVLTPQAAKLVFPELKDRELKEVDHIVDLNLDALSKFGATKYDFVIINHVLEHLVNPIFIIEDILRIIKVNGLLVLAIPDKEFTFDRNRPLTNFKVLKEKYDNKATDNSIYDYLDMAKFVHPEFMKLPKKELETKLESFKNRREHLNIWNSKTFKMFIEEVINLLGVNITCIYEVTAEKNNFEYFGIWRKID